ncbi:hypothetical protein BHM03_00061072 [Ensete ventricosum]|nr:hypothetical protein BHM03_00061072 [Ensete ventricosum]
MGGGVNLPSKEENEQPTTAGGGRSTRHCPSEEEGCAAWQRWWQGTSKAVASGRSRTAMQEDGGARCALLRDGLQIGMTALSFDSKEIAMSDRWQSLEKLSDGCSFSEKGLLRRRENKKKKGQAVGVLGAVAMLCFIVKRRSRFEKSIDRRNGKHRDKLCEMLWPDHLCRQPSSPPQERWKRRLGDGEPQLRCWRDYAGD